LGYRLRLPSVTGEPEDGEEEKIELASRGNMKRIVIGGEGGGLTHKGGVGKIFEVPVPRKTQHRKRKRKSPRLEVYATRFHGRAGERLEKSS